MNLKHEYFLTLVKQQSFSKAAEKLYISQPALSLYINALESKLGVKLFNRKKFPISLTLAGEKYLNYVQKDLLIMNQLINELEDIKTEISGKITIGIHTSLGSSLLVDLLPIFVNKYPKIEITLDEGTSTSYLHKRLENDEIDCGLIFSDPSYTSSPYEPLINSRVLLIGSKKHTLNDTSRDSNINNPIKISLKDIQTENLIVLKNNQYLRKIVNNLYLKNNLKLENYFETINPITAISLASAGLGLTFVPKIYLDHNIEKENLSYYEIENYPLWWKLNIVYNETGFVSNVAKKFIDLAKEFYKDYL